MLSRENSDYYSYRERTKILNSRLIANYYPAMATQSAALNPEPADPNERAEHNLPPKSYADAAQEPLNNNVQATDKSETHVNGSLTPKNQQSLNNGYLKPEINGDNLDDDKVVLEKRASRDGTVLVSVKPDPGYEESLKHNAETAPRDPTPNGRSKTKARPNSKRQDIPKSQLKSGRRAGAGWERSA